MAGLIGGLCRPESHEKMLANPPAPLHVNPTKLATYTHMNTRAPFQPHKYLRRYENRLLKVSGDTNTDTNIRQSNILALVLLQVLEGMERDLHFEVTFNVEEPKIDPCAPLDKLRSYSKKLLLARSVARSSLHSSMHSEWAAKSTTNSDADPAATDDAKGQAPEDDSTAPNDGGDTADGGAVAAVVDAT